MVIGAPRGPRTEDFAQHIVVAVATEEEADLLAADKRVVAVATRDDASGAERSRTAAIDEFDGNGACVDVWEAPCSS